MQTLRLLVALAPALAVSAQAPAVSRAPRVPETFTRPPLEDHFVHWESAHVHPLAMTGDGTRLLAVNTPDARLEVFDLTTQPALPPRPLGAVRVGLEPVTVRLAPDGRAWVVNFVSDSISIVDVATLRLVDTVRTGDEPCDVVFTAGRAWVSCAQPDMLEVYDLANMHAPPTRIPIVGEDPRALALAPDGRIFVAIRQSGNGTTILNGDDERWVPNIVSDPSGPYAGANPPPNAGTSFDPPLNPDAGTPPDVSLIVRNDGAGTWRDDNGADWTSFVTGGAHGRAPGWDLYDHDLAVVDTTQTPPTVDYVTGAMNLVFDVAIRPLAGGGYVATAVGTEATNEVRFEPNLKGTFVRTMLARASASGLLGTADLNPHLDYTQPTVPQTDRDRSLGDPRFHVWSADGSVGFVAGMGSNNVLPIDGAGNRIAAEIEVGAGPTGLVLDEPRGRLYVLDKFSSSLSVVDAGLARIAEVGFHDPTPAPIARGRSHLYDTHRTSGLGQVACASCHADAEDDGLAWDLGNPSGELEVVTGPNVNGGAFVDGQGQTIVTPDFVPLTSQAIWFHPMKGPMVTQVLKDTKEPLHWRGDNPRFEDFNGAFTALQGDDTGLSAVEMQEFEAFLASISIAPNPLRAKRDNALPTALDMNGGDVNLTGLDLKHHPDGDPAPPPVPLPVGDALAGELEYTAAESCAGCHTTSTGTGADAQWDGAAWQPVAPGSRGQIHAFVTTADGLSQAPFAIAGLRNMHEKTGFDMSAPESRRGFGLLHDGTVDTLSRFISRVFGTTPQQTADLSAFVFAFASNAHHPGDPTRLDLPPGPEDRNSHAGIGLQWTLTSSLLGPDDIARLDEIFDAEMLDPTAVGIVVAQNLPGGGQRGYVWLGGHFVDDALNLVSGADLLATIGPGTEATVTLVPRAALVRLGIDRDADGWADGEEIALGTDPANVRSVPDGTPCSAATPAAPSGLAATALGPHRVRLTWTDHATDESGFVLERALVNSPQWQTVATIGPNATVHVDTTVGASTPASPAIYVYRLRSYNCGGESATTASAAVQTPAEASVPVVHIESIALQTGGDSYQVRGSFASVRIVDDEGRPVHGVRVTAAIGQPAGSSVFVNTPQPTIFDPISGSWSTETNEHGQALFATVPIPAATIGTGWTYDVLSVDSGATTIVHDAAADLVTGGSVQ